MHGARAVLRWSRPATGAGPGSAREGGSGTGRGAWQRALLGRRPTNVVLVAMANKTARTVWAMLSRGEPHRRNMPTTA